MLTTKDVPMMLQQQETPYFYEYEFMKYLVAFVKARTWRWIGGFLLLIAPIAVWLIQFGNCSISDNAEDWGFFGDYIGGVYTVIVTFFAIHLTRYLQNRDIERNKAKSAYGSLYEQICKINYQQVDLLSVKRLLRLTNEYELYIPTDVYGKLTELYDDYVVAKDNPDTFQLEKEVQLKSRLKKLYDQ